MDPQPSLGRKLWSGHVRRGINDGRKRLSSVTSRRQRQDPQPEAPSLRPGCWGTRRKVQRSGPVALRPAGPRLLDSVGAPRGPRGGRVGSWESRVRTWSRRCPGLGSCAVTLSAWPLRRGWASEWPRRRARCRSLAASRILRWWSGSWSARSTPGGCCGRTTPRRPFVRAGVRIATCWDLAAVHRLLFGGWRADPARVWAQLQHLALGTIPTTAPADLFGDTGRDGCQR